MHFKDYLERNIPTAIKFSNHGEGDGSYIDNEEILMNILERLKKLEQKGKV